MQRCMESWTSGVYPAYWIRFFEGSARLGKHWRR